MIRRSQASLGQLLMAAVVSSALMLGCGDSGDDTTTEPGATTTEPGDTTTEPGDTTTEPGETASATGVYLAATEDCPQTAGFFDLSNNDNFIDYNGDGNDNAATFNDSSLVPSLSVACADGAVNVTSNGIVNYDYYIVSPDGVGGFVGDTQGAPPELNTQTFSFPSAPAIAAEATTLPTEGTVAVLANGIQLFGPNEALGDNGADPVPHGLLDFCNGHVNSYHHHGHPECFFNYPTLGGAASLLPTGQAKVVVGYALDGFPIYAPYECADEACSAVVEVKSSWDYDTSATWEIASMNLSGDCLIDDEGGYSDNYAWACNVFTEQKADTAEALYADECNGRVQADGSYAYYATEDFPYFLGCFVGTATNVGVGNGGGASGPPPGGGNGNGPPPMP